MSNLLFSSTRLFLCLAMMIMTNLIHAQQQKTVFPNPSGYSVLPNEEPLMINTPDGGWLIVNNLFADNDMGSVPWLIKMDASGATTWDKTYLTPPGPGYYYNQPLSVANAPDGGYMVSYRDDSTGMELLRIAENGDQLWIKDLGATPFGVNILGVINNEYYALGESFSGNAVLWKFDLAGNVLSSVNLNKPWNQFSYILQDNQEILIVYAKNGKTFFSRFDLNGNELWTSPQMPQISGPRLFNGPGTDFFLTNFDHKTITRYDNSANVLSTLSVTDLTDIGTFNWIKLCPDGNLLISGISVINRGFIAKVATDYSVIWLSEALPDAQPDIVALYALPTSDGWAAGTGPTTTNQAAFLRIGSNTGLNIKTLSGKVIRDVTDNCIYDSGETGIKGTKVIAQNVNNPSDAFYGFSNPDGDYVIKLAPGDYTINADPAEQFFFLCAGAVNTTVSFPVTGTSAAVVDLPVQALIPIHHITGKVILDENDDCLPDAGDTPLKSWRVKTNGSGFLLSDYTDADGVYSMYMPDGNYSIEAKPVNPNFTVCGSPVQSVTFNNPVGQTANNDFVMRPEFDCAFMKTWVGGNNMRPCTTSTIYINYQNTGTKLAENVRITVTLDPALTYVSGSVNPTSINGNQLVFELGNLAPAYNASSFQINVLPDCSLTIGQQLCVTSEVIPNEICFSVPGWNGAVVTITGECGPNPNQATFTISNIGNAANAAPLEFVIVEEQVVLKNGTFQLPAGGSQQEVVDISGPVQIGTADQEPGYPGDTSVTYVLNNCIGSGGNPTGFNGPASPFISQACFNVVNSFDPNDKTARPEGFGPEHIVWPGTTLDYRIRFQNTGNDTAFLVTILDTLSADLDPGTIELKGSSHPYRFDLLAGKMMQFTFENILLPDSLTNPEGSQGYVEFSIKPRTDLPLGTTVGNSAAIYFDFNKPVITNTVYRKFDKYFEVTSVNTPGETVPVQIYPNPALEMAIIELPAEITSTGLTFELMDVTGRLVRSDKFNGPKYQLICGDLASGTYFWKISENGKVMARGKVQTIR